ncbi:deazaflavin-dependent nitroreductase family protein [Mycolicibacterium aurum]|uniref:Deazaflavin-dependent nitroreductase family protein n=2 Tax=Mycolicibacterium aurum TaxID=1791 RepID=A0A3S4RR37_MYCAU|nr:deazaflavin-dependent nitroreductase family protein [Mycolicibacterium aurum]
MLRLAGRKHWYAAVIRHTGRTSGRSYATPVVADRVTDGFITPLPYGSDVDWLSNATAAGSATLTVAGRSYELSRPRVIDTATAASQLPSSRRRMFQAWGIDSFVKFDASSADASEDTHGTDRFRSLVDEAGDAQQQAVARSGAVRRRLEDAGLDDRLVGVVQD